MEYQYLISISHLSSLFTRFTQKIIQSVSIERIDISKRIRIQQRKTYAFPCFVKYESCWKFNCQEIFTFFRFFFLLCLFWHLLNCYLKRRRKITYPFSISLKYLFLKLQYCRRFSFHDHLWRLECPRASSSSGRTWRKVVFCLSRPRILSIACACTHRLTRAIFHTVIRGFVNAWISYFDDAISLPYLWVLSILYVVIAFHLPPQLRSMNLLYNLQGRVSSLEGRAGWWGSQRRSVWEPTWMMWTM